MQNTCCSEMSGRQRWRHRAREHKQEEKQAADRSRQHSKQLYILPMGFKVSVFKIKVSFFFLIKKKRHKSEPICKLFCQMYPSGTMSCLIPGLQWSDRPQILQIMVVRHMGNQLRDCGRDSIDLLSDTEQHWWLRTDAFHGHFPNYNLSSPLSKYLKPFPAWLLISLLLHRFSSLPSSGG